MRLYVVRHGKATDPVNGSDFDRTLTPKGQRQAAFLGEQLATTERRLRTVIASRYPRAHATALQITQALITAQHPCTLTLDPRLEVDHPVSEALAIIDEHRDERALMLVGHNPQLAELVSVLCAGLPPAQLVLRTGECVVIELRAGSAIGSGRAVQRLRLVSPDDSGAPHAQAALGA